MKRTINMKIGIDLGVLVLILTVCGSLYARSLDKNVKNRDKWSSGKGFAIKVVRTIEDGAGNCNPSYIFTSNGIDQFICPICDRIHKNSDNHWSGITETNLNKADICIFKRENTQYYYHSENKDNILRQEVGLLIEARKKILNNLPL